MLITRLQVRGTRKKYHTRVAKTLPRVYQSNKRKGYQGKIIWQPNQDAPLPILLYKMLHCFWGAWSSITIFTVTKIWVVFFCCDHQTSGSFSEIFRQLELFMQQLYKHYHNFSDCKSGSDVTVMTGQVAMLLVWRLGKRCFN